MRELSGGTAAGEKPPGETGARLPPVKSYR